MITFDDFIIELFRQELITEETEGICSNRGIVGAASFHQEFDGQARRYRKLEVDKSYGDRRVISRRGVGHGRGEALFKEVVSEDYMPQTAVRLRGGRDATACL